VGTDADCCLSTYSNGHVLLANLYSQCTYACYNASYNQGVSPCQKCDSDNGYVADGACPNWCSPGTDIDCCQSAGKCWLAGKGCYDTCSLGVGTCTQSSACSGNSDGCCPAWCAAGSDADCCLNSGKCWVSGQGCITQSPCPV
jgi:hypothetical protein